MSALRRVARWLSGAPRPGPEPPQDPIRDSLRAAVEANARAKADNTRSYEARVHAMIAELFLRMDNDARPPQ